ncbi:MAG: hypothetical protein JNJ57_10505 [Saprospiraceae bacterium]|nr:hypothetical protein [Saprospiraceae bacterium]
MEDFKQYLSDQADDAERQALDQVQAGLNDLRVEATVKAVAIARKKALRRIFWQRVTGLALLAALLGCTYWFFMRQKQTLQAPPVNELIGQNSNPPIDTTASHQTATPDPLLASSLRMTLDNAPANNTSSFWGNAVRALQRNNADEAEKAIQQLPASELKESDWLRGVVALLRNNSTTAHTIFQNIASAPSHPRKKDAALLVEALNKRNRKPMAAQQIDPPPTRFPAPNLRGANASDPALKALVDQVWYTVYPLSDVTIESNVQIVDSLLKARNFDRAYIQLQKLERTQPSSPTIQFLKGYCLLELGEGGEALRCFDKLEQKNAAWKPQLEWYRALGSLLAGDRDMARKGFQAIAAQTDHPFNRYAQEAVRRLK